VESDFQVFGSGKCLFHGSFCLVGADRAAATPREDMAGIRRLFANGAFPLFALLASFIVSITGDSAGETLEEDSPWGAVSLRALCRSGWPSPACDELDRDLGGAEEMIQEPATGAEAGARPQRSALGPGRAGPTYRTSSPAHKRRHQLLTPPPTYTAWSVDITGPTEGEVVVGDVAVTVELAWRGGDGEGVCSAQDRGAGAGAGGDCGACVRLEVRDFRAILIPDDGCVRICTHTQTRTASSTDETRHAS
jgi:hypothetical protein